MSSLGLGYLSGCGSGSTGTLSAVSQQETFKPKRVEQYIYLEAERFADYGGWELESNFINNVGSCYLIAKGFPAPVAPAKTRQSVTASGKYSVFCRCKNWAPAYTPGRFKIAINGNELPLEMGTFPEERWVWQKAGEVNLDSGTLEIGLHDLTGDYSRCSALLLTTDFDFLPPNDVAVIASLKAELSGPAPEPTPRGPYDLVVVGGGVAGSLAAIAAARNGCKVALVQNRPVLGGNASDEVGVLPQSVATYNTFAREAGLIEEIVREAIVLGSEFLSGLGERSQKRL